MGAEAVYIWSYLSPKYPQPPNVRFSIPIWPFELAKYRYFSKNIVFIAQLQLPAVTKVEIQSTNLVQFLKGRGLKFCMKHFFEKTVMAVNRKLAYPKPNSKKPLVRI